MSAPVLVHSKRMGPPLPHGNMGLPIEKSGECGNLIFALRIKLKHACAAYLHVQ